MFVSEVYLNATEEHLMWESGVYEAYTNDIGQLYRGYQKDYGRCISKIYVYIDPDNQSQPVGWVFQSRAYYNGPDEPDGDYLREVWVTLHDAPDTVITTPHYHKLRK